MKPRSPVNSAWWLNPIWFVVLTVMSIAACAWLISDLDYQFDWRTSKHFETADFTLTAFVVLAFVTGGFLCQAWDSRAPRSAPLLAPVTLDHLPWLMLYRIFLVSYGITIVGYILWFAACASNGLNLSLIMSMLHGESGTSYITTEIARDSSIAGATTTVQFAMACSLIGTLIASRFGWKKIGPLLAILLVITACRAFLFSERLAVIELVLPSGLLYMRLKFMSNPRPHARRFLMLLPIGAVLGVATMFTVTEYFRSWVNFYAEQGDESFLRQNSMRLVGYYATALNNGALMYHNHLQVGVPFYTLQFIWKFPVIRNMSNVENFSESSADEYKDLLEVEANPEFNNTSGIFVTFLDYGVAASLLLWTATGFVAVLLYRAFLRGTITGLLLYPFFFLGMMEMTRIYYWTETRAFPTWILLFGVVGLLHARERRKAAMGRVFAICNAS